MSKSRQTRLGVVNIMSDTERGPKIEITPLVGEIVKANNVAVEIFSTIQKE